MLVKLLRGTVIGTDAYIKGEEIELADTIAKSMIAKGRALPVEKPVVAEPVSKPKTVKKRVKK